jgi:hypothetical protein
MFSPDEVPFRTTYALPESRFRFRPSTTVGVLQAKTGEQLDVAASPETEKLLTLVAWVRTN